MGLTGTMYTGLSGLFATSDSIGVTSDNIANINTIGFRGSRAQFEDVLSRSIVGVGELGGGVRISKIEKLFSQGAIVGSSRNTDMAINGGGFFMVRGQVGDLEGSFYSRAGQFATDAEGFLVNPDGLRVQGYPANGTGRIDAIVSDLRIPTDSISPTPTTELIINANLNNDPSIALGAPNPADLPGTSDFSTPIRVYDSVGQAHDAVVFFTKTGNNSWQWTARVDPSEVSNADGIIASGALTFDANGNLDTETTLTNSADFIGAQPGQVLNFDFGDSITTDGGTGGGTTHFAADHSVSSQTQNGYPAGEFVDTSVAPDGTITSRYDNGQLRVVGRVALADFKSPNGLERVGGTLFAATQDSGDASVGYAGAGGRGEIVGSALEQSNVDLSEEFVKLITDQRAYQATSRTITTADELLAETVNLKR